MAHNLSVTICPDDKPLSEIVYGDPVTAKLLEIVDAVAQTPATVLITGESGVGKEVFARAVHHRSRRSQTSFVAVNCAAIPATLLESELFGHEQGAFSGATERRVGLFEGANKGTVFLDEVTEMPLELQAKILRVIQERSIRRVGGSQSIPLDGRIIAASNRDLHDAVDNGDFRLDLYYRLNVFPIHIPPLRQRRGDIRPLVERFAAGFAAQLDNHPDLISGEVMDLLNDHTFAGNVRELMNVVERAMIIASASGVDVITAEHIMLGHGQHPISWAERDADARCVANESVPFVPGYDPLTDVRMRVILKTLEHFDGNRTHTAEALGVSLRTVRNKIRDYKDRGVDVPEPKS
jgi:two-component system response regulator FlrC